MKQSPISILPVLVPYHDIQAPPLKHDHMIVPATKQAFAPANFLLPYRHLQQLLVGHCLSSDWIECHIALTSQVFALHSHHLRTLLMASQPDTDALSASETRLLLCVADEHSIELYPR